MVDFVTFWSKMEFLVNIADNSKGLKGKSCWDWTSFGLFGQICYLWVRIVTLGKNWGWQERIKLKEKFRLNNILPLSLVFLPPAGKLLHWEIIFFSFLQLSQICICLQVSHVLTYIWNIKLFKQQRIVLWFDKFQF